MNPRSRLKNTSSTSPALPASNQHPAVKPGLIDEQDGLRYLREECGMSMADELEILPLFERTPLGLASGHFFAMLRLVSWLSKAKQPPKSSSSPDQAGSYRAAKGHLDATKRIRRHFRQWSAGHFSWSKKLHRRSTTPHLCTACQSCVYAKDRPAKARI